MSLAIVINDIRKKDTDIQEPIAIKSIYGCMNMQYSVTPSKLVCACDTLLSTGVILEVLKEYININDADSTSHSDKRLWYKKPDSFETLKKLNLRIRDPYVSPVCYQDFDSLSDVNLYCIIGLFDSLLMIR